MEIKKSTIYGCAIILALVNIVYQMFFASHPNMDVAVERTLFQWSALWSLCIFDYVRGKL